MTSFHSFVLVFLGGGLGASFRYSFSLLSQMMNLKIWSATLFVNLLGCLIYFLMSKFGIEGKVSQDFIKIGVLGSLTTFSTFTFEVVSLVKNGQHVEALTVFMLNVVCGVMIGIGILR